MNFFIFLFSGIQHELQKQGDKNLLWSVQPVFVYKSFPYYELSAPLPLPVPTEDASLLRCANHQQFRGDQSQSNQNNSRQQQQQSQQDQGNNNNNRNTPSTVETFAWQPLGACSAPATVMTDVTGAAGGPASPKPPQPQKKPIKKPKGKVVPERPERALFCFTLKNPIRKLCIDVVEWKYPL